MPEIASHFINGRVEQSLSQKTFASIDPSTGRELARVAYGDVDDVERAVSSAVQTFSDGTWRHMPSSERGRRLRRVADLLRDRADELGALESSDTGKPIKVAIGEVEVAATLMEYAGALAEQVRGVVYPEVPGCLTHSRREPYGVVGAIAPWNFPLVLAAWKTAPALAVGNSVVLKMAEQTPLTTSVFAQLCAEAGIPAGALNVVHGDGATGAALVADPRVEKVTFTGSTDTGRAILREAAKRVKSVHLELGGKSPNIVFADADLDRALEGTLFSAFANTGQICTAGTRLLLEASIADEFLERLCARAEALIVGLPQRDDTQLGPLISSEQRQRVERYVALGREEGATLLSGGGRPPAPELAGGFFVQPTIFADVKMDMRIAREEIFGPVLAVTRFEGDDQAVHLANDSDYGLAATVWTSRLDRALAMVDRLETGIVWTNCPHRLAWQVPYEGHKQSGLGEDLGNEAIGTYTHLKVSYMQFAGEPASL